MRMPVRLLKKRESWNPLKHPFITLGVLSLLCVFITGEHPLWLLPAAGFALAGTGLTLYMAHSLPQKTKRPFVLVLTAFFWGLGGISFLMLEGAKKPALVLLNLGLPLVAVLGAYWLCRRMLTTRRAVLLLMAAGFLLRLAYVLTFSIYQKQHDAGSLESMDGHIGYIATLAFHGALPDIDVRTVYQFYHPPCHHIIAALWVRLQVLLGVGQNDTEEIADKYVKKMVGLRIFDDEEGKTNLSLDQVGGSVLLISQFTLYANCKKGYRPSFIEAGDPVKAESLYEYVIAKTRESVPNVQTGIFGAEMKVDLENDGPFTIVLENLE